MTRSADQHPPRDNSVDPEGEFPLGTPEYFLYLLFTAARYRDQALETRLKPLGLTMPRWRALAIIRRMRECTMTALALFSTIERTTLTRTVDHLVEEGLVERWVPARDRRQVKLALTDAGEALYGQAVAGLLSSNQRALDGLSGEDLRQCTRALQTLLRNIVEDEDVATELLTFFRPQSSPDA